MLKDEFRFRIQHNGIASEMNGLLLSSVQVVGVTTSPVQVLTTSASKGTLILPNSAFVYSSTTQVDDVGSCPFSSAFHKFTFLVI